MDIEALARAIHEDENKAGVTVAGGPLEHLVNGRWLVVTIWEDLTDLDKRVYREQARLMWERICR